MTDLTDEECVAILAASHAASQIAFTVVTSFVDDDAMSLSTAYALASQLSRTGETEETLAMRTWLLKKFGASGGEVPLQGWFEGNPPPVGVSRRARQNEFLRQEAEEASVSVDEMARALAKGGSSGGTGASAPKRPRDRMTLGKGGGAGGALESIMRLEKELEKDKQASVAACMASVASGFTALAGAIASRSAPNPAPAGAGGIMAEFLLFTEGLKNLHSLGCGLSQDFVQEYAVEILQRAQRARGVAGYNAPRVDGSVESSAESSAPRE